MIVQGTFFECIMIIHNAVGAKRCHQCPIYPACVKEIESFKGFPLKTYCSHMWWTIHNFFKDILICESCNNNVKYKYCPKHGVRLTTRNNKWV